MSAQGAEEWRVVAGGEAYRVERVRLPSSRTTPIALHIQPSDVIGPVARTVILYVWRCALYSVHVRTNAAYRGLAKILSPTIR